MLPSHSMLSVNSGLLSSVNSGMLPDGVVYRPNSLSGVHPGMTSAHSTILPNGAVACLDRGSLLHRADSGLCNRNDDTCTASSTGRLANGSYAHSRTLSCSSSTGAQPEVAVNRDAIVSLLPSGTEILYALGLADRY